MDIRLMPFAGIDNVSDDTALRRGGEVPAVFARDAVNLDATSDGGLRLRPGLRKVSASRLRDLWHSPLHGDTFARDEGGYLVRVDRADWSTERLGYVGDGELAYMEQGMQVLVSGAEGLFRFDGASLAPLSLPVPPAPMVSLGDDGSLPAGRYSLAVSWSRGGLESPLSALAAVEVPAGRGLTVTLPLCFDASVAQVTLYCSEPNGGRLQRLNSYPISTSLVAVPALGALGAEPRFAHMEPMPGGRYLAHWQGRLLTARRNVLRFSEPMAYHVHDPRHGFVQLPQRITFVAPVDGGVWIGQVDHVAFLRGVDLRELTLERRKTAAPVPGSALLVDSNVLGDQAGGRAGAAWLAANGHVLGTADGAVIEPRARQVAGIHGAAGQTVAIGSKLLSIVR